MRLSFPVTLAVFTACLFPSLSSLAEEGTKPTIAEKFDVGGFGLYLECYQNDNPVLILEQGFGRHGSDGAWQENITKLQQDFSVCFYDRSGLGKSDQGPVPYDIEEAATRLHTLLNAAEIAPPYYFAGGSYASYVITAYNKLYKDEVLGAMLIDPPPFGYFHMMGTRWPENFSSDDEKLMGYYQFEQSVHNPMFERAPEKINHMKSYEQLVDAQDFGDKPVLVLRAKPSDEAYDPPFVPGEIGAKMDALFNSAEASFLALSSNSKVLYSDSPKHHLHLSDPDNVIRLIRELPEYSTNNQGIL